MKNNKKDYSGIIKSIKNIALNTFEMKIESDLEEAHSGQFISILCPNKTLRRPFSIADFDFETKILTVLFKLKGEGTNYLKSLNNGDKIKFLAPLGNRFKLEDKNCLLVGAGIGIAPMLFLKKELNEKGYKNYLISGFKENNEIICGSDENVVGGSVLDNLDKLIKEKNIGVIYSCGPSIVLKKVAQLAKENNIQCYVAMERVMACSIGVCRGCVIKIRKGEEVVYGSVCQDGPVFKGCEVVWD
ncbi:dihydroorotate dehydrogenase electron transfer subunit [bacterium]|nr:dihydroorotate dehydrogenase electron transfer subunit [bacterium]